MELAINLFNKGLLMDTHPMILGNDTLSDALNATFVTMNGNEVILQNDMGNRRIDNAYLPEGYEPIGIKEYGGIIYIAAYNPLTNSSQIGSFPSPERRISKNDDPNLGALLNLNYGDIKYSNAGEKIYNYTFNFEQNPELDNIKCLIEDTVLIPLTNDTSLHAGDKFIVYTNDSNFEDVSNYNNFKDKEIDESGEEVIINKVISPKNKLYTLSLGILNSQNEFVDITSSLVRWDKEGNIIDTSKLTDILKFNIGYFIRESSEDPGEENNSIKDLILNEERNNSYQLMESNTYSYKLIGPLYLLAKLNHILDFIYNITGEQEEEGKVKISVEGTIIYNCPDGLEFNDADTTSNSIYIKYLNGELKKFIGFDFYWKKDNEEAKRVIPIKTTNPSYSKTKYDPSTNLYTIKLTKEYQFTPTLLTRNNGSKITQIDYVLGVCAINDEVNEFSDEEIKPRKITYYLSGLSSKGTIDLTKFGSGEIFLNSWRFVNEYKNNKGTIKFGITSYPKKGEMFTDLTLKFTNVKELTNIYYKEASILNLETVNLSWVDDISGDLNKLWKNALYKVNIIYNIVNTLGEENIIISEGNILNSYEFYLTTDLFNDCFDKVLDFGNPKDKNGISIPISEINPLNNTYTGLVKLMADKLLVSSGLSVSVNTEYSNNEELRGSLLTFSDDSIKVESTLNCNIKYTFNTKSDINCKQLYPSWITINGEVKPTISDLEFIEEIIDSNRSFNTFSTILNKTFSNNVYNVDIKLKDLYYTEDLKEFEGEISSAFDSFANYIESNFSHNKALTYSGFMIKPGPYSGLYFAENLQEHGNKSDFDDYTRRNRLYLGSADLGGRDHQTPSDYYDFYSRIKYDNYYNDETNYNLNLWNDDSIMETLKECFVNTMTDKKNNNKVFALSGLSSRIGGYYHGIGTNIKNRSDAVTAWRDPGNYFYREREIYLRLLWKGRTKESENVWAFIDVPYVFQYYKGYGAYYSAESRFDKETVSLQLNNFAKNYIENEAYIVNENIKKQLINEVFPKSKDIYYCRFKKINVPYELSQYGDVQRLYISNKDINFNQYESKTFNYYLKYKISSNEDSININSPSENILNFCKISKEGEIRTTDKINLYTGQKFINYLTSNTYDYVSLKDGINRDSDGNILDPNNIYYRTTDGLGNTYDLNILYHKLGKDVPLITERSNSNENALLCVPERGNLKNYNCDIAWYSEEDIYSWYSYNGLWRINIEEDINQKIDNYIN